MATSKRDASEGANQTPAANIVDVSRFTWNIRGFNESLTVRCDTEDELKQLRDRWSQVISPPRRRIPYMHGGDTCLVADCGGIMLNRTGTNRKTQKPYQYLKCSKHPTCQFYAYLETEQNTPEQNGENGNGQNGHVTGQTIGQENGHEQRAVAETSATA